MDRASRSELLNTVESQQEQLQKYETKLRDVVVAYKGLLKEKEALEASLKALTSVKEKTAAKRQVDNDNISQHDTVTDEATDTEAGDASDEVSELQQQLATLTISLSTLSDEKSKLHTSYQTEKRKLKQEKEEAVEKLTAEKTRLEQKITDLHHENHELRSKIRVQQQEREKEQDDHAIMLRELQKLLANERMAKENLEQQLDETKQSAAEKEAGDVRALYEKQVSNLSNELDLLRKRLQASEEKSYQPSPLLLTLQEEMAAMKASHRIAIQEEQIRAKEKEYQLKSAAQQSEERVSVLEAKLADISQVISSYEKLRNQDQQAIHRLRERVSQLDMENTALARAASHGTEVDPDDTNLDVHALLTKITHLKAMVKLANERSEKPVNIEELLRVREWAEEEEDLHRRCREEYDQLKDEFEKYKLRAQSVLKNKQAKESTPGKEMEELKIQVSDMKDRVRQLRKEAEEKDEEHVAKLQALHRTMENMQEEHSAQVTTLKAEHKQQLTHLEIEMRRHRDRTISLLAEKDREIDMLRARTGNKFESEYVTSLRRMSSQVSDDSAPGTPQPAQHLDQSALSELFSKNPLSGANLQGETSLLHFAQEQARKDVEISSLRKQKHSLESALREQQHTLFSTEEKYKHEVSTLEEEIRRLNRNINRESANLEYLKNVVYQYMVCRNTSGRQAMLNAIATILQFSPTEKDAVHKEIHGGWWGKSSKR